MLPLNKTDTAIDENRRGIVPIIAPVDPGQLMMLLTTLGREVRITGVVHKMENHVVGRGNMIKTGRLPVYLVECYHDQFEPLLEGEKAPRYGAVMTTEQPDPESDEQVHTWVFTKEPVRAAA